MIPAHIGTTYCAILRVMYGRPNRRVLANELTSEAERLLSEFDGAKSTRIRKSWGERPGSWEELRDRRALGNVDVVRVPAAVVVDEQNSHGNLLLAVKSGNIELK